MYISKTVVTFSSNTATWQSAKRITKSADINGVLREIILSGHTSTAKALHFYRDTTTPGQKIGVVARSTKERSYKIYGTMHEAGAANSSSVFGKVSTGSLKFPWILADEKIVICGATQTAGTVTIYVDGTVGSTQV